MIDYDKIVKTGLDRLKNKNFENWSVLIKLCFDNPMKSPKGFGSKKKVRPGVDSTVNPLELMRFHPVLNKFEIITVKLILAEATLVKLRPSTLLYGTQEKNSNWYLILFGALVLH